MQLRLLALFLALSAAGMAAGPLMIGVRGGVPFTDLVETGNSNTVASETKRYIVGPTFGINLPLRLTVSVDGLYKRFSLRAPQRVFTDTSVNSWEFPAMLRWRSAEGVIAPVFSAGANFRHLRDFANVTLDVAGRRSPVIEDRNSFGYIFGAGLHIKAGVIDITPELRYTRWNTTNFSQAVRSIVDANRNQVDFLVGFTF